MALKQITFRVEPEVAEEIEKSWRRAGFRSLQEAGPHAFRTAFAEGPTAESVPSKYRLYVKMLEEIFASGDQPVIDAAISNVKVFHDRLRPVGRKARPPRS